MANTQLPSQKLKIKTKKHVMTCLREQVAKLIHPLSGGNITLYEENPDCWSPDELIPDYTTVVNLTNQVMSPLNEKPKTLKDGCTVCAVESELTINLEIYALGCKCTKDSSLMILAQILPLLFTDKADFPKIPYVRRASHGSTTFSSNFEYDTERTRLSIPLNLFFDFVPSRPSLLFTRGS